MIIQYIRYIFLLLLLSAVISSAEIIKTGSIFATSDGVNVNIHWVSENEQNVLGYEILRSTSPSSGYLSIANLDAKGASSYIYIDNTAFKRITTLYCYRIKVKTNNGDNYFPPLNEPPISVDHNVSGVRRTWGSIKALFR
ncbi:MAG: hypothetical protein HY964_00555 [Ignavibacteriales bacterium]|nr:hypothetical protein [Ignavibacteriales bacterium]